VLLDGHHRFALCRAHNIPFTIVERPVSVRSREDAVGWIIANQLGRRNLTPEQQSYLRGKRYNVEKHAIGTNQHSLPHKEGATAERLAEEYGVSPVTIERDPQFAKAVDTLSTAIGPEVREEVLERPAKGEKGAPKRQVVETATMIEARRVEPLPFMRRSHWKTSCVLEAVKRPNTILRAAYGPINARPDQPCIPAEGGWPSCITWRPRRPPRAGRPMRPTRGTTRVRARWLCPRRVRLSPVPPPVTRP
jgi:hypothetical protein